MHGVTGLLCEATAGAFADAMWQLIDDKEAARTMGTNGRKRVMAKFSFDAFATRLDELVKDMVGASSSAAATNANSVR